MNASLLALLLAGCPKPATEPAEPSAGGGEAPVEAALRAVPPPLAPLPFELPATETRTLSNGLRVVVATNREVPLWDARLLFRPGSMTDPAGREGLAAVTLDMMNEGAGALSAEDISRELKRLGSSIATGAGDDGATVSASGMKRNLAPTLDLWAKVLLEPTFPAQDWEVLRKRRIADLEAARKDPSAVAARASEHAFYGDAYRGRQETEASLRALTTDEMRAWYGQWLNPRDAILLVGGDVDAEEIVPLLEARLGAWKPAPGGTVDLGVAPRAREPGTLYFIHHPGASQSVIRVMGAAGSRLDPDYFDFFVANEVLGGNFTSRVNMNLREDKGYTYGARCSITHRYGPEVFVCATSVKTEVTGPALAELRGEIGAIGADRPFTPDEIRYFVSNASHSFPGRFETTDAILGEKAAIWRYGLPDDWTERFLPSIQGVDAGEATAAYTKRIIPDALQWLVVGDRTKVLADLQATGLKIVELDHDGNPTGGQ